MTDIAPTVAVLFGPPPGGCDGAARSEGYEPDQLPDEQGRPRSCKPCLNQLPTVPCPAGRCSSVACPELPCWASQTLGGPAGRALAAPRAQQRPPRDVFTLGVASGDPLQDGVVLWTRLAPDPLNGGGMPDRRFSVQWQVANDERFTQVVREGSVFAAPEGAHSVHVEVSGLQPGRDYFYRFRSGPELSLVGRTRTAPPPGAPLSALSFAFASCQAYTSGSYTAYRRMSEEDLDLVVHLGDYIYEGGGAGARAHARAGEIVSLQDYRIRHAQYRTDADLQAAHAERPAAPRAAHPARPAESPASPGPAGRRSRRAARRPGRAVGAARYPVGRAGTARRH